MIIPFLCDFSNNTSRSLGVFHKMINFSLQNKMPFIVQDSIYKEALKNEDVEYNKYFDCNTSTINEIKKVDTYLIEQFNFYDKDFSLMKKTDKNLKKILLNIIKKIEEDKNKKIEAILVWTYFPTLEEICKSKGIELIQLEFSSIRYPNYKDSLCYFSFHNKYDSKEIEKDYLNFLKDYSNSNDKKFTRKELIALFLDNNIIRKLIAPKTEKEYEFGIDIGLEEDEYFNTYSHINYEDIYKRIDNLVKNSEVLVRAHPASKRKVNSKYDVDKSNNSIEWINKCRRIVSVVSNVGFEAILFNRVSYVLSNNFPFSYNSIKTLDRIDNLNQSNDYVNFIMFSYFTPLELAFDYKYIKWRMSKPKPYAIYLKNKEYILNKKDIIIRKTLNKEEEFLKYILTKNNFIDDEINYYINDEKYILNDYYSKIIKYKDMEIDYITDINNRLNSELINIKSSFSYKIAKPFRYIYKSIRGDRK